MFEIANKVPDKVPDRVTVTLPDSVKDLFAWLKAHDPRFSGTDAAIAAFLMEKGAEAYYQQGLEAITPLDSDVFNALAESGISGIRQTITDEESESQLRSIANHKRK
jgi:hypothetical protein